jgi:hypothetical protein
MFEKAPYIWEYLVEMKSDQSCEWGMKPNLKWSKPFGEPSISPRVTFWYPFTSLLLFTAQFGLKSSWKPRTTICV